MVRAENAEITDSNKNSLSMPEGRYIRITISDDGIGIPEENLARIFILIFRPNTGEVRREWDSGSQSPIR